MHISVTVGPSWMNVLEKKGFPNPQRFESSVLLQVVARNHLVPLLKWLAPEMGGWNKWSETLQHHRRIPTIPSKSTQNQLSCMTVPININSISVHHTQQGSRLPFWRIPQRIKEVPFWDTVIGWWHTFHHVSSYLGLPRCFGTCSKASRKYRWTLYSAPLGNGHGVKSSNQWTKTETSPQQKLRARCSGRTDWWIPFQVWSSWCNAFHMISKSSCNFVISYHCIQFHGILTEKSPAMHFPTRWPGHWTWQSWGHELPLFGGKKKHATLGST